MIDDLLRSFVSYVYPLLPIVDLESFLGAVNGISRDTISIVIFQAVMFAGSTFADLTRLQHEGLQGHTDARKVSFHRVKLLYEMVVEIDPTAMVQVLPLINY